MVQTATAQTATAQTATAQTATAQTATAQTATAQTATGQATGWIHDLERGPDWLFITLADPVAAGDDPARLGESIWSACQQHFIYRLVLDCQQMGLLTSTLIGQLLLLERRLHAHGGLLRLCALSQTNQRILQQCRLSGRFPRFHDRAEAVLGHRPLQPR